MENGFYGYTGDLNFASDFGIFASDGMKPTGIFLLVVSKFKVDPSFICAYNINDL